MLSYPIRIWEESSQFINLYIHFFIFTIIFHGNFDSLCFLRFKNCFYIETKEPNLFFYIKIYCFYSPFFFSNRKCSIFVFLNWSTTGSLKLLWHRLVLSRSERYINVFFFFCFFVVKLNSLISFLPWMKCRNIIFL